MYHPSRSGDGASAGDPRANPTGVYYNPAMRTPARAVIAVVFAGCASTPPPPEVRVEGNVQVQARLTVRVNCEAICRQIERACRQACRPQAWSPNMQSIADSCEHDCDFNRFSCVSECSR